MKMVPASDEHTPVSRARYERERKARQEAERLLEEKSRQLFDAERARSSFLAMLSHELKTPLNGILGSAQILDTRVDVASHSVVHAILESGVALNAQIDSLLCLAELHAGEAEVENSPVLLQGLLTQVAEAFRPMLAKKDLNIRITMDEELQRPMLADRKRLRQILTALVSNAVKYTPQGIIGLAARKTDEGFSLFVSDSGVGVPEHKREKIFEDYLTEESFRERSFGGAGIALPVVRETVVLLGGHIEVTDSLLGGACFAVHLPSEYAPRRQAVRDQHGSTPNAALKVLIVDDNKLNRVLARHAINLAQMSWVEAENGAEALELMDKEHFDLVLMDIRMPVMTGDEAIRRIRARKTPDCNVPIIVLTAHAGRAGPEAFKDIGADYTLEKPAKFEELLSCMERVMGRKLTAAAA